MKKPQVWLAIISFLFGVLVIAISINSSVSAIYPTSESQASHRQFYLNNTILPDHVAYPLLMIVDKAQLEMTPFPKRLWLQAEYGWRRLDYAHQFLDQDNSVFALTALTKSQKYFLNATQETLDTDTTNEVKLMMLKHFTAYLWEAESLADRFDGADKAVVEHLIKECDVLKLRLSQSLSS
ncbi:MAG: hypothetical protein HN846_02930 [Candidatus Pacebacteria bacterium]|jgi:hypothetical protein|nr:hypothetical protein [Candidatus Paceibacterota bacterium]MBT3511615.1 hypothetical protein [Candidatus Paceibacterota bacterium]MBT4004704.1 hypothetical protein [Candidatus Paceibacterota bacterium]MBT4359242.1 hypothetical protein [Candidatus Paceibacterota bacterium]MBT4681022.1 hypothetical protein [Candidatus Paceibacterota bacterium]